MRLYGRGYCIEHYNRWRRHGDPLALTVTEIRLARLQQMADDVAERSRADCWKWEWATNTKGYGILGRDSRATHISLELDGRSRPEAPANQALHSCDNKWCWNPDHLRWGTNTENRRDYAERWGYCPHCDHCNDKEAT